MRAPLSVVRDVVARIRGSLRRSDDDTRLAEEVRFHIDMQVERNRSLGMTEEAARRDALRRFGGRDVAMEAARDELRSRPVENIIQDIRYAFRTLRRSPAFTVTAVATLAVGIGANTAIFSAVDTALLKPLPFTNADRVLVIGTRNIKEGTQSSAVAPGTFVDLQERARTLSDVAAAEPFSLTLQRNEGPEMVRNWNVTEGFFRVLGVHVERGRTFEPADFVPGAPPVVVISHGGWQRRFGGDSDIVGRHFLVGQQPVRIVGVVPANAAYPFGREMWSPKILSNDDRTERSRAYYQVIARLRGGITPRDAFAELHSISEQLAREHPTTNTDIQSFGTPIGDQIVGNVRSVLYVLLGAVGLVLLIACANVANLLLTRTARRGREFAIRAALGASPWRIVRQLIVESLMLAIGGAAGGVLIAHWSLAVIRALSPTNLPRVAEMHIDSRALGFAVFLAAATTAVFGLMPAFRAARTNLQTDLKSGGRSIAGHAPRRARGALVIGEVALAVVLLVGSGLLVRSFVTLLRIDRGYRSDHVLTATVFFWQWNPTEARRAAFMGQAIEAISGIPGVSSAGATSSLPIPDRIGPEDGRVTIVGRPQPPVGEEPGVHVSVVTPGTLDVLRIPRRDGRDFTRGDDAVAPAVVLVNDEMVRRYWPNENPIGRRILLSYNSEPIERVVVGVVGNVRQGGLENTPQPAVFIPHAQAPTGSMAIVVRTTGDPSSIVPSLRATLARLNHEMPIASAATLDDLLSETLKPRRFNLLLLCSFGLTALTLAIIGVYGLIAHAAAERTQEIGVRMALGATGVDVLRLIMGAGLSVTIGGVLIGSMVSLGLTRLIRGMLFGVTPLDGVTFVAAAALMLLTAALACYLPARRAMKIDPVGALRAN